MKTINSPNSPKNNDAAHIICVSNREWFCSKRLNSNYLGVLISTYSVKGPVNMKAALAVLVVAAAICGSYAIDAQKLEEFRTQMRQSDWVTYNEKMTTRSKTRNSSPPSSNCECEGSQCNCCSTMPGGRRNVDGCIKAKIIPESGRMHFRWNANGKTMFDNEMDPVCSEPEEPVCQPVPGSEGTSDCCVTMNGSTNEDSSMTWCPHMELNMADDTGATCDIQCIHYKDGQMTVGDKENPSEPGTFTLKYKEPMQMVARHVMEKM
ncbi:hypothetical protein GE061_015723 [Apolygus lucorum]|uniref:DUF4773 domain-containing protein n=1 Tax=Apolygus lucorum TaxID=248454 RepID=A0A8S9XP15_APOLU|nr:hypothetical protein GE061_015723 [Apolygus lucorum]